jgi:DNA-binding HxlR family transcriptional regulator
MLISTLKELASDGIVVRTDFREVPPRVEYSLTEFGLELSVALLPLDTWGDTHLRRISRTTKRDAR